jgi:hypothetical protein
MTISRKVTGSERIHDCGSAQVKSTGTVQVPHTLWVLLMPVPVPTFISLQADQMSCIISIINERYPSHRFIDKDNRDTTDSCRDTTHTHSLPPIYTSTCHHINKIVLMDMQCLHIVLIIIMNMQEGHLCLCCFPPAHGVYSF